MTPYLVVQGTKCRVVWQHQICGGRVVSLAQATEDYSIGSCVVLGEPCIGWRVLSTYNIAGVHSGDFRSSA